MTKIARNQWYVAAYGREIDRELFARTICDEPILFWRTESGEVTAMSDRCVHRRFPLSQAPSRLAGDTVVCGYHGFTYGSDGGCVAVPGQKRVPRTARLKSYPVVEQDSFVWIWIADPDRPAEPDPTRIPRAPWLDAPGYAVASGMEPLRARYSLLVDNLMDLSHETYLHGGYIGTPEVAETPITTEVDDEAGIVYVSRHIADAECPPFYAESTGLEGRITRWQDIEYHPPCLYLLHSRIAPVGVLPPETGPDSDAFHVEVVYAITPETEHSTHDFWSVARDFALEDEKVTEFLRENNRTVVLQDVVALDRLEQVLATEPEGYQELSINIDAGALAARRILQAMTAGGTLAETR
ncbi:Rieske 2Fe-2S domain-containing protein [Rhodococcus aetherivorans]|jgi:vanillate O-demethylase monooxygenase subunit|uniref:Aromatic ring-hydroxylating dioxygenase subunit alpha n=1 Tax=Rhodococcus aetherivorans TaxID=191292 RepID=A0A059MMZ0_9NOCA|nr:MULTISPECIES: aromatic ring-hydroxylating dioxygenase subunit alpha [Rhodococcus]ETT28732.1 Vanillate monooxygenase [Rhodococcus rhodochrous ATCC 21198]ANZ24649.1 Rieske (2Fe-2S) protein [Rhodococcus sp. WB1]KDE12550.1 Rieske (2Fe-2S) protein [Rhodococcus aetherivorans]NGP24736.1 aromatic ring-hydroxylating dioxygenase subunit alpha [Rhodococcus aetherivorans]OLL16588.1 Rieske (2Fe-2S) protein [Rhodococcus sp. M8]